VTTRSPGPTPPGLREPSAGVASGHALRCARRHRRHRVRLAHRARAADAPAHRVGAVRGDRFLQIGLRGYWPPPDVLDWMAAAGHAVLRDDRDRPPRAERPAWTRLWRSRWTTATGLPVGRHRRVRPGHAPGTGTPEPGGCPRESCWTRCGASAWNSPSSESMSSRSAPPYDHADITAALANRVVLEALSAIARRRQDARDGTRWDPSASTPRGSDPWRELSSTAYGLSVC
jgi:hypothetical protein